MLQEKVAARRAEPSSPTWRSVFNFAQPSDSDQQQEEPKPLEFKYFCRACALRASKVRHFKGTAREAYFWLRAHKDHLDMVVLVDQ
jgi:hypothetical protein